MIFYNDLPEIIYYNDEPAYQSKYYGYYATKSGKCITVKVKGGQGSIDINNPREHCYKIDKDGYKELCLSETSNGVFKRYYRRLHRFVYETIEGDIPDELTVDHKNMNKQKNNIENLRLLTREENTSIARKTKLNKYVLFNGNSCIGIVNGIELEYIIGIDLYLLNSSNSYGVFNWSLLG